MLKRMRVAITGVHGQVGSALVAAVAPQHTIIPITHADIALEHSGATQQLVALQPEYVIHSAAWTDVDGCARDPQRALLVNALGTKHVALACQHLDVPLVYISTNEVFDGAATQPYLEFDRPNPINSYGYSKWAGELVVQQLLHRFAIVRVAWVFGGPRSFVRTVLRLAQERTALSMVDDEIGNPTYAPHLAHALRHLVEQRAYGVFHLVNEGACSRFTFAQAILEQAGYTHVRLNPIPLAAYQRDSTPPRFGALHNFVAAIDLGIRLPPWQDALADALAQHHHPPARPQSSSNK
jgi:dTDP-4-dehydrorhamnose reductase